MNPYAKNIQAPFDWTAFFSGAGGIILLWLVIVILIFLIAREIFCWYFKINEGLDILNGIREEFVRTNTLLSALIERMDSHIPKRSSSAETSSSESVAEDQPRIDPLPSEGKNKEPTTHEEKVPEVSFSERIAPSLGWVKAQAKDFSIILKDNKRIIAILALMLIIIACLSVLSVLGWAYLTIRR
jgi:hypothetical protein